MTETAERRPLVRDAAPGNAPITLTVGNWGITGKAEGLMPHHDNHLAASAIDPDVIAERGYYSVFRGSATDAAANLDRLKHLGIPKLGRDSDARLPGLVIPLYRPTGERGGVLYKPDHAPKNSSSKTCKYIASTGPSVIDVHPRNVRYMDDPTVTLWITEGTKKADALTSREQVAVSISGVYNWRSSTGTLGDWEDIRLAGRKVVICFDSDATQKKQVLKAMDRLGKWLKAKKAKVFFCVTPPEYDGTKTKGVDDYFAAGGDLDGLREVTTKSLPKSLSADTNDFDDARMAQVIADDALAGQYVWCSGLGWQKWDGVRWIGCSDQTVEETVRLYCLDRFSAAVDEYVAAGQRGASTEKAETVMKGWQSMQARSRRMHAVNGCKGILEVEADRFDARPDVLNTPDGIVDLRTGQVTPHDPEMYLTRITRGSYRMGFTHTDWAKALTALPKDVRDWMQVRIGQGITGHPTPDGRLLILQGGGENGKSLLTTEGGLFALGDYAEPASAKLFTSMGKGGEHSTEVADLRGKRLLVAEELTEGRSIDVTALKRIQDVGQIKARYVYSNNMTFVASHTLMCTTNYIPIVNETDHGTWRRLVLVRFPYRFLKPGENSANPNDREGDPTLKMRIKAGKDGQHDAIVTWAVEGAMRWYADVDAGGRDGSMEPPESVGADTQAWRVESDRILGYWTERLVASPGSCVWAVDLMEDFNAWLSGNGHSGWSKETFGPRFLNHTETSRHGVAKKRTMAVGGLDRPALSDLKAVPRQPEVYTGVRFRRDWETSNLGESGAEGSLAEVADPSKTFTRTRENEKTFLGSATSATPAHGLALVEPDTPF